MTEEKEILVSFTKLLKSKDATLLEINPIGTYTAVINRNMLREVDARSLGKYIPQIKTAIMVEGKPEESIALYEVEKK